MNFVVNQFDGSIMMFNQSRATLYPISAIQILNFIDYLDHGGVNMSANHALAFFLFGISDNEIFKVVYECGGLFHFRLAHGTE